MKRYRIAQYYFDGTRNLLRNNSPNLVPQREEILKELVVKFGQADKGNKLARYKEFDPPNIWILSEYTHLLTQIADAYVFGSYYPTLTGACSLGERIFNILIIRLREYYKYHPSYKKVLKDSFQDWEKAIGVLKDWNVIDDELKRDYHTLAKLRNESIHFGTVSNLRASSLASLQIIMKITNRLFGLESDIFFWCPGELYVKKNKEKEPFVKEFILPNCVLLGYKNTTVEGKSPNSILYQDNNSYEDKQISDEEFRRLRIENRG